MAYTRIHSIKRTVDKSLDYITNAKKTTFVGGKSDLEKAISYISNSKKTKDYSFVEGWQCDPQFATRQFEETKKKYLAIHGGKERNTTGTPTAAFHFIQSFGPEVTDPVLVHQIGMELAEKIGDGGYQCVVASHIEGSHVLHNHIICNAYPLDPYGHKYHRTVEEYQKIRQLSDEIGLKYGIEPIISSSEKGPIGIGELNAKKQGNSWKQRIKDDIEQMSEVFDNWDDFAAAMIANGYKIEEHDGYVKYESPYSKKPVRDRTLGETYTRDYLKAQWDPEEKEKYEKKKAEERKAEEDKQAERKKYDAAERERWRQAEKLAAQQSKKMRIRPEDKAYKVARYDTNGHRRSNVQLLFLVAVKIIRTDGNMFEDQTGLQKFPYSPIYAPRDWKMQRLLEASNASAKYDIKDVTDIDLKLAELGKKLSVVSTDIRKKKAYLNRVGSLSTAIEQWKATKDIITQLDALPKDKKEEFKTAHANEIKTYNAAMAVFNKFSGQRATTPIMVYDPAQRKRVVSTDNINMILGNLDRTKIELDTLQDQRKEIGKQISQVRRIATSFALSQNDLFVHGPQYTPEKLAEIRARAKAEEEKQMEQLGKVNELDRDDFDEMIDGMLQGEVQHLDGFESRNKDQINQRGER